MKWEIMDTFNIVNHHNCYPFMTDWCEFDLTLTVPSSSTTGGPYFLNIGIMEQGMYLQYYGLNDNSLYKELNTQFVVYNANETYLNLTWDGQDNSINRSFYSYEPVRMKVFLGDELKDLNVFVAIESNRNEMSSQYYLDCGYYTPDYYTAFGWRTLNELSNDITLPNGRV